MPYCPKCKFEYHEGVNKCPDCWKRLVPRLPEQEGPKDMELVPVFATYDQGEAAAVKGILEGEGIPVLESTDRISWLAPYTGPMDGLRAKITLSVTKERADAARNLLREAQLQQDRE